MTIQTNEISAVIDGKMIPGWKSYSIQSDILKPADGFEMSLKFSKEAYDLCRPDARIRIMIDTVIMMDGFIDTRGKSSQRGSGTQLTIGGRDRSGRLVDESSPLFAYGGLHIKELAEKIVGLGNPDPIFESVVLVNTRNRNLLRKVTAQQARVVREPLVLPIPLTTPFVPGDAAGFRAGDGPLVGILDPTTEVRKLVPRPPIITPGIFRGRSIKKKVEPGSTRWAVLEQFLREARLLAWSTGDGSELFIGLPNYDQQPQYAFYEASATSASRARTNAKISITENVAELYAKYTVVGASRGTVANYGKNIRKNRFSVFDNPENKIDGTGARFTRPKSLLLTDDSIKSWRAAKERAEREQLQREAQRLEVVVNVPGHSQLYSGEVAAIYAVDTMARVFDEDTGTKGEFYVTSCTYTRDRGAGTETELRLVPRGTLLQL